MRKVVVVAFLLFGYGSLAADPLYTYTYVGQPYTTETLAFGHLTASVTFSAPLPYTGFFSGTPVSWTLADDIVLYSSSLIGTYDESFQFTTTNGAISDWTISVCAGQAIVCGGMISSAPGEDRDYQGPLYYAFSSGPIGQWSGATAPLVPEPYTASLTALALGVAIANRNFAASFSPKSAAKGPREL